MLTKLTKNKPLFFIYIVLKMYDSKHKYHRIVADLYATRKNPPALYLLIWTN